MMEKSKRFQDKTKKLHRLLSLLRKLDNRERLTPHMLAEKFDIDERTIYRDISDLNAAGFSITFDKEANTYRFTDLDFTLRDLDLNDNELKALLIGRQIAKGLGKPFEKAFQSILKKVRKDTGLKTKEKSKSFEDKQWLWVDIDPMEGFEQIERQYNAVNEAIDKKAELEIVYKAMKSEEETKRAIAPYGLVFQYGLWYVIGRCSLRKDIRVFALDCIKDFRLTNKHYSVPADFRLDEYFKPGWHMLRYGEPVKVVLEFTKEYARWIKRRKWHPTQEIEERPDGGIEFRVTVQGTRELKWWLYHWIPHCRVLSPPELRDEMMGEMMEMLRVYGVNLRKG